MGKPKGKSVAKPSQATPRRKYLEAQMFYKSKRYQDALSSIQQFLASDQTQVPKAENYQALLLLGKLYIALSKANYASKADVDTRLVEAMQQCFATHPESAEPMYELTKHFNEKEDYEKAYTYGKKAIHLTLPTDSDYAPHDPLLYDFRFLEEMVWCAKETYRFAEAIEWSKRMLQLNKIPANQVCVVEENITVLEAMLNKGVNVGPQASISNQEGTNNKESHASTPRAIPAEGSKVIGLYLGPSPLPTNLVTHQGGPSIPHAFFGSELAAINLCNAFTAQGCQVIVFADNVQNTVVSENGVKFMPSFALYDWGKRVDKKKLDVMIVSRYVMYFIQYAAKTIAHKTVMWLHDIEIHPYYNKAHLPNQAIELVKNLEPTIDGYVCGSEWHKGVLIRNYELPPSKVHVIGLGIDADMCKQVLANAPPKTPLSFIWVSDLTRNLPEFISTFVTTIKPRFAEATLHIYRSIPETIINRYKQHQCIHFHGYADNKSILRAMASCEYFVYPTEWNETYCLSAHEAQAMGMVCITTPRAALATTVGDRGILVNSSKDILQHIVSLEKDPSIKNNMRKKAQEWALAQTWATKAEQWLQTI